MPGEKTKVSCPSCGATNYFPRGAEGKKVVCGRCKTPLPPPGTVLEPGTREAVSLFRNAGLPILVDFYSPTCAPCLMMHPVVERLAKRRAGEITAVRINVEKEPEIAREFGIQAVPTFVIVSKGVERARTAGALSETDFSLWVASQT
jgi:thioredoxin 2